MFNAKEILKTENIKLQKPRNDMTLQITLEVYESLRERSAHAIIQHDSTFPLDESSDNQGRALKPILWKTWVDLPASWNQQSPETFMASFYKIKPTAK